MRKASPKQRQILAYRRKQKAKVRKRDGNRCMNPLCQHVEYWGDVIDVMHVRGVGRGKTPDVPDIDALSNLVCGCRHCHNRVDMSMGDELYLRTVWDGDEYSFEWSLTQFEDDNATCS